MEPPRAWASARRSTPRPVPLTSWAMDQPNSWFIAFDTSKDVAIAALVLNSGYDGAQFAAPEVESFLDSY